MQYEGWTVLDERAKARRQEPSLYTQTHPRVIPPNLTYVPTYATTLCGANPIFRKSFHFAKPTLVIHLFFTYHMFWYLLWDVYRGLMHWIVEPRHPLLGIHICEM